MLSSHLQRISPVASCGNSTPTVSRLQNGTGVYANELGGELVGSLAILLSSLQPFQFQSHFKHLNPKLYSPPYVDRIWLWVYYNQIPIYPIFYLLKED